MTAIEKAIAILQSGELVAIPTETVYGLAADATNEKAVAKIFEVKNRPFFDPLIVHVADREKANSLAYFNATAEKLASHFWPGPLTILLPKKDTLSDLVTSGLPNVGLRVPSHALTIELLKQSNLALAAPSANPFMYVSPSTASHVKAQLGDKIPYILDGGDCSVGIESTIIDCSLERAVVRRLGGLDIEKIGNVLGYKPTLDLHAGSNPKSPGQYDKHYAPKCNLIVQDNLNQLTHYQPETGKEVLICFGAIPDYNGFNLIWNLSHTGDFGEAAANLFKMLRRLDEEKIIKAVAVLLPEQGLGMAINDRLRRASKNTQLFGK